MRAQKPRENRESVASQKDGPAQVALTTVLLIALPLLVYYVWYCLEFSNGYLGLPEIEMFGSFPFPTAASTTIVGGWLAFQVILQILAPGRWVEGPPLMDGSRLRYRMNGWFCWCLTWGGLVAGTLLHVYSPSRLVAQLGPLLTTANIAAWLLSLFVYFRGERPVIGSPICSFWRGTVLNPRLKTFDLKLFCEARPGLIAWVVLDMAFAAKQYELYGFVSLPMILVCSFHFWYVSDYFWHEEAILSTWDIKHERFGWMLCWGDLVWVPFIYTIQAYYLIDHMHDLPLWAMVAIASLYATGFVVFRGANLQKHRFRKDPMRAIWGRKPRFIETATGSSLLTSGWWGGSRHMNYFGDLLMGIAWCLPCGFGSPLPYFYILYLTGLLVHRERRDHRRCLARYGTAWEKYCAKVSFRIVPGFY